jgi:putative hemolysin
MKKKNILILVIVLIVLFGALILAKTYSPGFSCWPYCGQKVEKATTTPTATLANPASVHCEEVGGTLDIRTGTDGGQVGYCIFPDKSECEEWALLRGECAEPFVATPPPNETRYSSDFRNLNINMGDKITSPLKITGEARGGWFFEASFPINLVDWDGRIIAVGIASTKADWMNNNFLPFEAELTFTKPANPTNQDYASKGTIIFKADNPSGLSKNDKAYELPVRF